MYNILFYIPNDYFSFLGHVTQPVDPSWTLKFYGVNLFQRGNFDLEGNWNNNGNTVLDRSHCLH